MQSILLISILNIYINLYYNGKVVFAKNKDWLMYIYIYLDLIEQKINDATLTLQQVQVWTIHQVQTRQHH